MGFRVTYQAEVETTQQAQEYLNFFKTIPNDSGKVELREVTAQGETTMTETELEARIEAELPKEAPETPAEA